MLGDDAVRAILDRAGIVDFPNETAKAEFLGADGVRHELDLRAEVVRVGPPLSADRPLVTQVSRWDPLKDPIGVLDGYRKLCETGGARGTALVLAGPDVRGVADDPEGAEVFEQVVAHWRGLPDDLRARIHLVSLPMSDVEQNAAMVNALQRHSAVIVQKSLKVGFGLTVTEAMWKERPVVASAVGGILDQIEDGVHGLLVKDPADIDEFARVLGRMLADPEGRRRMGRAAHRRVREEFLGIQHLWKYGELLIELDEAFGAAGSPAEFTVAEMPGREEAAAG